MRQPTVEWQVAGACNYDCSYCIQSKKYRRGRPSIEQYDRAIAAFADLPGQWEIKCSGGEAFAHKLFLDHVVPGLMNRTPHRMSVLTNFSSSRRDLMRFARLTAERLHVFSASLHLEHTELEAFADKAAWFVELLPPEVSFVVNQVVLPGKEAQAEASRAAIESRGLRWFPQRYKRKGYGVDYPNPRRVLPIFGEDPTSTEANMAPSYQGQRCWSGVEYFVVDKDGEAWACRTGKRTREGNLGNVFEGTLRRMSEPSPCAYDVCPCTVPANRGMIEGAAHA